MREVSKKILAFGLALSMLLAAVSCAPKEGTSGKDHKVTKSAYGQVWSAPSTVKVDKMNIEYDNKGEGVLSYQAVRNEYESCQLIITAKKDVKQFALQVSDLKKEDAVLSAENVMVYVQKYIHYSETNGNGYLPDALIPMDAAIEHEENTIEADRNGALWVTIYIPKETEAGIYEGTFQLSLDGEKGEETLDIPVTVEVFDYTLTDEINARTMFTNRDYEIATGELDGSIEMITKYFEFFLDYRLSLQSLPLETLSTEEYVDAVEKYYDRVSTYNIQVKKGDNQGGVYKNEEMVREQILMLASRSTAERNLLDKAYIYTIDEPDITKAEERALLVTRLNQTNAILQNCVDIIKADTSGQYDNFKKIRGWETYIADMKNVVTHNQFWWLLGNEDTEDGQAILEASNCVCPVFTNINDTTIEQFENMCEKYGITVWWYGCMTPNPPATTYHISDPNLLSARTISWLQSKYDVQGNLYWNPAGYTSGVPTTEGYYYYIDLYESPYRDPEKIKNWPAGDGYLAYPGAAYGVYGPLPSLRLMSIRDGMEEYEILEDIKSRLSGEENLFGDVDVDSIMNMFYSSISKGTAYMFADGEQELNFSTLRNSLLSFVSGLENGLGFVLGNVAVKGEKANVTYYVQDGAIVSIDGQQQKPVSGTTYQYKMDLAKDTYIHVTVENASGKSVVYNQFVSKPVYVLSALSDAADLDGITVTEGSQAEFVTNDMYSVDGTAVHLKVNGVVTGDILEDATFKPSVTIDTAMFTESIADYATVQISMYNPGEAFTVAIKTRSGSSNAALGDYEIPTGMTTLELDLANQIANFETIDAIVLEFNNVADEAPLSYEFYMDNIVGDK